MVMFLVIMNVWDLRLIFANCKSRAKHWKCWLRIVVLDFQDSHLGEHILDVVM